MKNHHNAIRNWNNMKNNATPAESKVKTPSLTQEESKSSIIEEKTTSTVTETTTILVVEESTTSTTTETTTETIKTRLPNFTNKK